MVVEVVLKIISAVSGISLKSITVMMRGKSLSGNPVKRSRPATASQR